MHDTDTKSESGRGIPRRPEFLESRVSRSFDGARNWVIFAGAGGGSPGHSCAIFSALAEAETIPADTPMFHEGESDTENVDDGDVTPRHVDIVSEDEAAEMRSVASWQDEVMWRSLCQGRSCSGKSSAVSTM